MQTTKQYWLFWQLSQGLIGTDSRAMQLGLKLLPFSSCENVGNYVSSLCREFSSCKKKTNNTGS